MAEDEMFKVLRTGKRKSKNFTSLYSYAISFPLIEFEVNWWFINSHYLGL